MYEICRRLLLWPIVLLTIVQPVILGQVFIYSHSHKYIEVKKSSCFNESCYDHFTDLANSPLVECSYLSDRFYECEDPSKMNNSNCKWGMTKHGEMQIINVTCRVFENIECRGPREYIKLAPCIKYTDKYFVSTLLYSIFLGIFAVDRCCIGHTGIGIGKLITLGGFGIWYMIDIILLVLDVIKPSDNSHWIPYY